MARASKKIKTVSSERADYDSPWKIELIRLLYQRGYARQQVIELFRFIDWILDLPEKDELIVERVVSDLEEIDKMKYISTMERRAIQRGLERGWSKVWNKVAYHHCVKEF